jgi:GalNAc5-diNAcBac-PP-undecaprenol beta-1,3-glucosyltransferase
MIFFSVIIPTYNRAHLVAETIESVLAQTHPAYEIILVDDGSTDNTKQLFETRYSGHDKIRYFYKQNEERGAARNFGLKEAKGEYAVFFDSDDWMLPGYLSMLNEVITDHPGIFILAAKYNYNNHGRLESHPVLRNLPEGWYDRSLFLKGNIMACNFCLRIHDKAYQLFQPDRELASMEDWLCILHNLENEKMYIKDAIGVTMRQHDERSMMNNKKVIEARNKATAWLLSHLKLDEGERKTLLAWSHYFCGIHFYLDHNRRAAWNETIKAIRLTGVNKKFLQLLIKSAIGRKIIKALR